MKHTRAAGRQLRPLLHVLPLTGEDLDALARPKLESGEWWVVTGVSAQMLELLAVMEERHYEGEAKPDLQVISGLSGPAGPTGMVILAKKDRLPPPAFAAALRAAGAPLSFELLETRDILLLASEEEQQWMQEHGLDGSLLLLLGSTLVAREAAVGEGEPDPSRGMYARLVATQHYLVSALLGEIR